MVVRASYLFRIITFIDIIIIIFKGCLWYAANEGDENIPLPQYKPTVSADDGKATLNQL